MQPPVTLDELVGVFEELAQMVSDLQAEVRVLRQLLREEFKIADQHIQDMVQEEMGQIQRETAEALLQRAHERALKERKLQ